MDDHDIVVSYAFVVVLIILGSLILSITGCSQTSFNPACKCSCKESSSYFECTQSVHHEKMEIK